MHDAGRHCCRTPVLLGDGTGWLMFSAAFDKQADHTLTLSSHNDLKTLFSVSDLCLRATKGKR